MNRHRNVGLVSVALGTLLAVALSLVVAQPAWAAGPITITSAGNGYCLQAQGDWAYAPVVTAPCNPADPLQKWHELASGRGYELLQSDAPGHLCMDVVNGGTADGTRIQLWSCNFYATGQHWKFGGAALPGYQRMFTRLATKCVDAFDPVNVPPPAELWTCSSGVNYFQSWYLS